MQLSYPLRVDDYDRNTDVFTVRWIGNHNKRINKLYRITWRAIEDGRSHYSLDDTKNVIGIIDKMEKDEALASFRDNYPGKIIWTEDNNMTSWSPNNETKEMETIRTTPNATAKINFVETESKTSIQLTTTHVEDRRYITEGGLNKNVKEVITTSVYLSIEELEAALKYARKEKARILRERKQEMVNALKNDLKLSAKYIGQHSENTKKIKENLRKLGAR